MYLGYNTNGFAHHDLFDAVELLAEIGYQGIAITIDHGVLSPRDPAMPEQLERLATLLRARGLRSVVETGARFLLDRRMKHEPTLVSPEPNARQRRIEFYKHCIDCAATLGSDCVSIWSGVLHRPADDEEAFGRLIDGLSATLAHATERGVTVAFEPEPGMFIDCQTRFAELLERLPTEQLKLSLDVGHLQGKGEAPIADYVAAWSLRLANVHLDDAVAGRHEHLMFGDGEIDFPPVFDALRQVGYEGGLFVELSRHSHMAPVAARSAFEFLSPMMVG